MKLFASMCLVASTLFTTPSDALDMQYSLPDEALIVEGDFEIGDAELFSIYTEKYNVDKIILNSPGGMFYPSLGMIEVVLNNNIHTVVKKDGYCISACAFLWMMGETASLYENSSVGFHPVYEIINNKKMVSYYAMSIVGWLIGTKQYSIEMLSDIMNTDPEDVLFLKPDLAEKWDMNVNVILE